MDIGRVSGGLLLLMIGASVILTLTFAFKEKISLAFQALGVAMLLVYILLGSLANWNLYTVSVGQNVPSWENLPNWVFNVPLIAGAVLVCISVPIFFVERWKK